MISKGILALCMVYFCLIYEGSGQIPPTEETSTNAPRPREMEEEQLILLNVAAKGRVVELLANELARTEIIRALLVQYAKECVQNVTALEKHCLNCMMERCENRISECNIKTPPLSEVINHDPIPIPGVQFLSQTPRDVQKHLKDFTSRARTDILEGIPESLRQESETIIHKEVDQSLQDLSDNIDTDKALQTISVHMQKAADNVHKIPELSSRVGAIIIANEGHAVNLAELLASRLRQSRPFVESIEHNGDRIAEQMPAIIDHVTERVSDFKDKVVGVMSNVLDTFTRIMDQPDTNVINGNTMMQGQVGLPSNFNPNMQIPGGFPVNRNRFPNVQRFPQSQRQRFVNMNFQQQLMQSQFPNQLQSEAFPSPLPGVQAQMTNLNFLNDLIPLQSQQGLVQRVPNLIITNLDPGPPGRPPLSRPLQQVPLNPNMMLPVPSSATPTGPLNKLQVQPPSQKPQTSGRASNQINPNLNPSGAVPGQTRQQFPTSVNKTPINIQQNLQPPGRGNQIRGQPSPQARKRVRQPQPGASSQGSDIPRPPISQRPRQSFPTERQIPNQRNQNQNAIPSSRQQQQGDMSNQIPQPGPRPIPTAHLHDPNSPHHHSGQITNGQIMSNTLPTGPGPAPSPMTSRGQSTNAGQGNLPNIQRNQVKSVQRINTFQRQQQLQQNRQFRQTQNAVLPGRRRRHTDADCDKLEDSPEKYCKQYESHCHNCTLEKRLRFEVCGEGVERARDEIKRLDESVEGYLTTYDDFIVGERLVLKVEMDDEKRLHKTNSYYDAYITAKIGDSIVRYKTKMILNSADTRASGSQIGDEIWEKLWDRQIFKEARRRTIEHPEFSIMGQTSNRRIPSVQTAAQGSGESGASGLGVSYISLTLGTAMAVLAVFL